MSMLRPVPPKPIHLGEAPALLANPCDLPALNPCRMIGNQENTMTKTIRVENADTSSYKVIVEVWDKPYTDRDGNEVPAKLARTINLDHPCSMTPADLYLTSSRYLIVKEAE